MNLQLSLRVVVVQIQPRPNQTLTVQLYENIKKLTVKSTFIRLLLRNEFEINCNEHIWNMNGGADEGLCEYVLH